MGKGNEIIKTHNAVLEAGKDIRTGSVTDNNRHAIIHNIKGENGKLERMIMYTVTEEDYNEIAEEIERGKRK